MTPLGESSLDKFPIFPAGGKADTGMFWLETLSSSLLFWKLDGDFMSLEYEVCCGDFI